MTFATRLAVIGASSLLAAVLAFALPLPASLRLHAWDRPYRTLDPTTAGVCDCSSPAPAHHV